MPRKKRRVGDEKHVTVTDKSGKVTKTKVKRKGEKWKEKIKKDGTIKQVRWIDGKRTVEKFNRYDPDVRYRKGGAVGPNKVL